MTQTATYQLRREHVPLLVTSPSRIQEQQYYKTKISEAIMVLTSNVEVMTALQKYYDNLLLLEEFPLKDECRENIKSFSGQMDSIIDDLERQASRARHNLHDMEESIRLVSLLPLRRNVP